MPINAPMSGLAGAITAFWCLIAPDCFAASATDGGRIGPLNVQRYIALKERLGLRSTDSAELSYFDNLIYQDVMNLLIDSVLQSEGSRYCLTPDYTNRPTGMLFHDLVRFVDSFASAASPDQKLRDAVVDRFATAFPCSRK
jgi:hypothetical protein